MYKTTVLIAFISCLVVAVSGQFDALENQMRDGINHLRNGENHVLDAMNRAESDLKNMRIPKIHMPRVDVDMPNMENIPGVRTAESK